jgi:hypothetical protein
MRPIPPIRRRDQPASWNHGVAWRP